MWQLQQQQQQQSVVDNSAQGRSRQIWWCALSHLLLDWVLGEEVWLFCCDGRLGGMDQAGSATM